LNNFAELEAQIVALPSARDRGNAFEVFAEAWLATQVIPQAREVWPGNTLPLSLQDSLRLPLNDMGVDGVFESEADDPTCYQVKFRTGRPRLSWSDLSTFFGLADAPCGRLVFTNCDEIASVAEARRDVVFVRGGDLDRLTKDDLALMDAWLAGSVVARITKSPRPHQEAAVLDILAAFENHSRATALMACATGKTLISLWATHRLLRAARDGI
jgi:predicted helicase